MRKGKGNGGWRIKNGEGEWRMAHGECRIGNKE